jgi:hypothetical protein
MEYIVLVLAALFAVAGLVTMDKPIVSAFMALTSVMLVGTLVMAVA